MTDPLEILRPEVRDTLDWIEAEYPEASTIRAELLRLAVENATARGALETLDVEGHRRAEKAEAELAALKARIAEGVYMGYPVECYVGNRRGRLINPFTPAEWIGKRVRLLVDEPPAKRGEG